MLFCLVLNYLSNKSCPITHLTQLCNWALFSENAVLFLFLNTLCTTLKMPLFFYSLKQYFAYCYPIFNEQFNLTVSFWSSWLFSIFTVPWLSVLWLYVSKCLCLHIQHLNTSDSLFLPHLIIPHFLLNKSFLSSLLSVSVHAGCLSCL